MHQYLQAKVKTDQNQTVSQTQPIIKPRVNVSYAKDSKKGAPQAFEKIFSLENSLKLKPGRKA